MAPHLSQKELDIAMTSAARGGTPMILLTTLMLMRAMLMPMLTILNSIAMTMLVLMSMVAMRMGAAYLVCQRSVMCSVPLLALLRRFQTHASQLILGVCRCVCYHLAELCGSGHHLAALRGSGVLNINAHNRR